MQIEDAIEIVRRDIQQNLWKTGTVSGTSGTRVIVTVQGSSMTIPRLTSYTPTTGDVVLIASTPIGYIAIGKPA